MNWFGQPSSQFRQFFFYINKRKFVNRELVKRKFVKYVISNELITVKLPPWEDDKADTSSVCPSSERSE